MLCGTQLVPFQLVDNKRDQFRRYVESHGVVDMLTKVLIQLMTIPEKPENPIEFIREQVGASLKEKQQMKILEHEVEFYRQKVDELTKQLEEIQVQTGVQVNIVDSQADSFKSAELVAPQPESVVVVEAKESSPAAPLVEEQQPAAKEIVAEIAAEGIAAESPTIVPEMEVKATVDAAPVVVAATVAVAQDAAVKEESEPIVADSVKLTESEQKIAEIAAATSAN